MDKIEKIFDDNSMTIFDVPLKSGTTHKVMTLKNFEKAIQHVKEECIKRVELTIDKARGMNEKENEKSNKGKYYTVGLVLHNIEKMLLKAIRNK